MNNWIRNLFEDPDMTQMGHAQSVGDLNLGLGWLYYSLARTIRPKKVVVIGSYRGFVPLVFGKALHENGAGEVVFIDPSLVDDFWRKPERVEAHFANYQVHNIHHHLTTTQDFLGFPEYSALDDIGILFVDGFHSAEQAKFDHEAFQHKMADGGVVLFHDSVRERRTRIYGDDKAYVHTVCHYMAELRSNPAYEVMTFPEGDGLTMVKRAPGTERP